MSDPEKPLNKLTLDEIDALILSADEAYHNTDEPVMSDARYDALRIERANRLGIDPAAGLGDGVGARIITGKVKHKKRMMSLGNAFSHDDAEKFLNSVDDAEVVLEHKLDGLSLSLRYEDGVLVQALTRGDGEYGEDVTENVKRVKGVPLTLKGAPRVFEPRGEVVMLKQDFKEVNKMFAAEGKKLLSNPRNAAAGSLRQKNPDETARRPLTFFAYALGDGAELIEGVKTQKGLLDLFSRLGFNVADHHVVKGVEATSKVYEMLNEGRDELPYDVDGVVYKVNDLRAQASHGYRSTTPRWAIAHKFPPAPAWTKLIGIDIQVGRTGALTPVARLQPVEVGGVIVSNVTLHNEDYVHGYGADGRPLRQDKSGLPLDLRVGDTVRVYRAGDVIPKIDAVNADLRPEDAVAWQAPLTCPECGSVAVREAGDSTRRCSGGLTCPAQAKERLCHFVSRDALDIEGLGPKQINVLFDDQEISVREPAEIFTLQERSGDILSKREGFGKVSANNLFSAINDKRSVPLAKFLYGLGIRHVGETVSSELSQRYGSWDALVKVIDEAAPAAARHRLAESAAEKAREMLIEKGKMPKGEISKVRKEMWNTDPVATNALNAWNDLLSGEGVGETIIFSLVNAFSQPEERGAIDRLKAHVTVLDAEIRADNAPLKDENIVFTGTLTRSGRSEAKRAAEALGAKVSGSVGSKTTLLVAGENAGSKLEEARKRGIKVIDEDAWLGMIGQDDSTPRP